MSNYSAELLIFVLLGVNIVIAYFVYDWIKSKANQ